MGRSWESRAPVSIAVVVSIRRSPSPRGERAAAGVAPVWMGAPSGWGASGRAGLGWTGAGGKEMRGGQ